MRASEFINEATINVPDQLVTVQVPLKDLISGNALQSAEVVNPGKRAGADGSYKWSPPLQQHLDAVKDAIGPSDEELQDEPSDDIEDVFRNKLAAILSSTPSMPGQ